MKNKHPPSANSVHSDRNTSFVDYVVLLVLVLIISFWVVDSQIGDVMNTY